ncbi:MAG: DUF935 domain-containing protein [Muribaculaceae bacterium]|nr:DUF935 domain-containing protein [Roseburia sp.]MCM1432193.1 DUF935 domain-containing protein [Muribaculaceae bacterium]MCM1493940.1 DUF935 domain-containing protein [Muribaculaceae bacterium]
MYKKIIILFLSILLCCAACGRGNDTVTEDEAVDENVDAIVLLQHLDDYIDYAGDIKDNEKLSLTFSFKSGVRIPENPPAVEAKIYLWMDDEVVRIYNKPLYNQYEDYQNPVTLEFDAKGEEFNNYMVAFEGHGNDEVATVISGMTDAAASSYEAGKSVVESLTDGDDEVYAVCGYPVTKGEVLVGMNLRISMGIEEADALQQTVEELSTKKFLFAEAVQAGFQVTDEEYAQYVRELKESMENAENKDMLEGYYKGFGGEDIYWKIMEPTIRQNLSIRNYLNSMGLTEEEEAEYKNQAYTQVEHQIDVNEFTESVQRAL